MKDNLQKEGPDGKIEFTNPVFCNKIEVILRAGDIDLNKVACYCLVNLEKWKQQRSGWIIDSVQTLWLDVATYRLLKGSCCGFIIQKKN